MNKKKEIAIYSGSIPSTTFIENLIKGIATKHNVLLFGKQKNKPNYDEKTIYCYPLYTNKLNNLTVTIWRTVLLLLKFPKRFKVLREQLKPAQGLFAKYNWWSRYSPVLLHLPDVFHIQWAKDLESWMFLKELNVKVVLSLRGAHINYSPVADAQLAMSYRRHFPNVDAFHAVSNAIKIEAQKYGADSNKIKIIHSLITQSTFDLFRLPEKRDDGILRIISVGRHHWKKGYSTALEACKNLKDRNIPFIYTIVAQGQVPEELIIQRDQLDLSNEVVFKKGMGQTELFGFMLQNDVLLLPSLEEGIANVVLESMAMGVPVVSTDCGGMNEVVISNETGWLVPILDQKIMADALTNCKEISIVKKQKIVKKAFELVSERFKSKNEINSFVKFYQKIL